MSIRISLWRAGILALCLGASSLAAAEPVLRGEPIPADGKVTPIASILEHPREYDGQMVITEGTVKKACMFAGCWMTVGDEDVKQTLHVTFSKGAFTVPRSSARSHVRMLGRVKVSGEKATFIAKGVELRRD